MVSRVQVQNFSLTNTDLQTVLSALHTALRQDTTQQCVAMKSEHETNEKELKNILKLGAGHSIECITHAGHSIAFSMFLHFVNL